jgi:hypothetical protein
LDAANTAALAMYAVKTAGSFTSPASMSINERFSQSAQYQKIMQRKVDGKPISMSQGMILFSQEFPQNLLDLTSTSQTPKGDLPEDKSFMDWANKAPNAVAQYPAFLAYMINRNSQYAPSAYHFQTSTGLRSADTPEEYWNATLGALGQDYYYNFIEPKTYAESGSMWYGPNNPNNNLSVNGNKILDKLSKAFGEQSNYIWYDQYSAFSTQKDAQKFTAVQQLSKFMDDVPMQNQLVKDKLLTNESLQNLQNIWDRYTYDVGLINQATSQGGTGSAERSELWNDMQTFVNNPAYSQFQYLITGVLSSAPNANG